MSTINNFRQELNKILNNYVRLLGEDVDEIGEKVAKDGVKRLKMTSPKRKGKGGGDYAKGWRAKKVGNTWTVHNATDYQLTHLLEKGHALRQGGRSPAIVHIKPVEQDMINDYVSKVEKAVTK